MMATPEQVEQVRELANKVDELKGKVHNFIFWQRVRFLIGASIGGVVGGLVGTFLIRWLNS